MFARLDAGNQTHLEFIPERTSDFIFAVYSEEFGLIGNLVLLVLFLVLVGARWQSLCRRRRRSPGCWPARSR